MVPSGQVYSVTAVSTDALQASGGGTYTASTGNRSVSVAYKPKSGVFIEDKQGLLYPVDIWSSGNNANANSVVVASSDHVCRIALQGTSSIMQMSSSYSDPWDTYLSGTTNAGITNSTVAKTDYNGATNTNLIVTKCQSSTSYAAGWCNAYTFPDGSKGYLPSLGELNLAYQNKAAVDAALAKCGGTALPSSYHWSSTFYGSNGGYRGCWILRWSDGYVYNLTLDYNYYVRAFGAH